MVREMVACWVSSDDGHRGDDSADGAVCAEGMRWFLGLASTVVFVVTYYAYLLMSRVLDHCKREGRRDSGSSLLIF